MKKFLSLVFFFLFLLTGCHTEPKHFTLMFTLESIGNYRISIEINDSKNYQIKQQNLYFDVHARREQINTSQGILSDEEFAELKKLIAGSRLFKMKDAYGFDQENDDLDPLNDLIYQLQYTEGRKTKNITLRPASQDKYSEQFLQLIALLVRCTNQN